MWPTRSLVGNSTNDLDVHKTNLDGHMSNINVHIGLSDGHNASSDVHFGLSDGQNGVLDAHNGVRVRHCLAALGQTVRRRSRLATRTASPRTLKQCHQQTCDGRNPHEMPSQELPCHHGFTGRLVHRATSHSASELLSLHACGPSPVAHFHQITTVVIFAAPLH